MLVTLTACVAAHRRQYEGRERDCPPPPPRQPVRVDSAMPARDLSISASESGLGEALDAATFLVRRGPRGDTLLYALGDRVRLTGIPEGPIELKVRRIGYFPRTIALVIGAERGLSLVVPLERMPADWCGMGEAVVPK